MTTGTAGTVARQYHQQMLHYLRKRIDETHGATISCGWLPAGAVVLFPASGVQIHVVFSGTNPTVDVGITGTLQKYASVMDLDAAVAWLPLDVTTAVQLVAADVEIIATLVLDTPVAADGSADVIMCFLPNNDQ